MPLPALSGPIVLHFCMLFNSSDAQVLALWQIVFQLAAGAHNPSGHIFAKVPFSKVKIDFEILNVGKVAAYIVGNRNKDIGIRE